MYTPALQGRASVCVFEDICVCACVHVCVVRTRMTDAQAAVQTTLAAMRWLVPCQLARIFAAAHNKKFLNLLHVSSQYFTLTCSVAK